MNIWIQFMLALSLASAATLKEYQARLNKNPNDIPARQEIARDMYKKKKFKEIIELLAPYANEINGSSLSFLADSYEKENDILNQTRTLEIYVEREPNSYRPYYLLGEVYLKTKDYTKAADNFRTSIKLAPKHRQSYSGLLVVFTESKQTYEARTLLTEMIKIFGPRGEFITMQCKLHVDTGFLAEALNYCKDAVRRDPKTPDNHVHLAQAYDLQKKPQAAERVFIQAAKQFQKSEYVQWAAGEHYFVLKNYPTAARYLKVAVKLDPKSRRAQLGLAESMFEMGEHKTAVQHYFIACKLDTSNVAREAFRTAASKLRNADNPAAYEYDKYIQQCP